MSSCHTSSGPYRAKVMNRVDTTNKKLRCCNCDSHEMKGSVCEKCGTNTCPTCGGNAEACNCPSLLIEAKEDEDKNINNKKEGTAEMTDYDTKEITTSTGGKIIRSSNRSIKMNRLAKKLAVNIVDEIDSESDNNGEKVLQYLGSHIGCLNQKFGEGKIDVDIYLISTQKLEKLLTSINEAKIPEEKLKSFFDILENEIKDCIE